MSKMSVSDVMLHIYCMLLAVLFIIGVIVNDISLKMSACCGCHSNINEHEGLHNLNLLVYLRYKLRGWVFQIIIWSYKLLNI